MRYELWHGESAHLHDDDFGITGFGGRFALVFTEVSSIVDIRQQADAIWSRHNKDDRPRGREIRSMSVGDVIVLNSVARGGNRVTILRADMMGFKEVTQDSWLRAHKQTEGQMEGRRNAMSDQGPSHLQTTNACLNYED